MSKPMLIPYDCYQFRHPHLDPTKYGRFTDPTGQDCVTIRPNMDPVLVRYYRRDGETSVRAWLACGLVVEWELPDA